MDPQHGQAEEAGDLMHSELDAIQERLRELKRGLDARESVASVEDEDAAELAPQSRDRAQAHR